VLLRDPAADLQPTATYLMSLGLSPNQLQQLVCLRPEVLTSSLDSQIKPFVDHLKSLGCSALQCGEVLLAAPHLLRDEARAAIAARLAALGEAGIDAAGVRAMLARGHAGFLFQKGAPQEALACLKELGFTGSQVRRGCARVWLQAQLCFVPCDLLWIRRVDPCAVGAN
jgi:hypothetical protein